MGVFRPAESSDFASQKGFPLRQPDGRLYRRIGRQRTGDLVLWSIEL